MIVVDGSLDASIDRVYERWTGQSIGACSTIKSSIRKRQHSTGAGALAWPTAATHHHDFHCSRSTRMFLILAKRVPPFSMPSTGRQTHTQWHARPALDRPNHRLRLVGAAFVGSVGLVGYSYNHHDDHRCRCTARTISVDSLTPHPAPHTPTTNQPTRPRPQRRAAGGPVVGARAAKRWTRPRSPPPR